MKYPVFPTRPYMMQSSKPFLVAVNLGQDSAVKSMLNKSKFLIFQIDSVKKYFKKFLQVGKTALHRAAKKSNFLMVKLLLKYRPDVNACDFYGKTAMTYAIEADNVDIAKVNFL